MVINIAPALVRDSSYCSYCCTRDVCAAFGDGVVAAGSGDIESCLLLVDSWCWRKNPGTNCGREYPR